MTTPITIPNFWTWLNEQKHEINTTLYREEDAEKVLEEQFAFLHNDYPDVITYVQIVSDNEEILALVDMYESGSQSPPLVRFSADTIENFQSQYDSFAEILDKEINGKDHV